MWLSYVLAAVLAIIVFLATSGLLMAHSLQSSVNVSGADKLLDRPPSDSYSGRAVNILVLGSDSRKGAGNKIDNSEEDSDRSDTAMIVHIAKDRKSALVVSIPRDTMVEIPPCKLSETQSTRQQRGQFNWAYSLGGQNGSTDAAVGCTLTTVESVTHLHIDDYVVVDFNGFTKMIDALGGIRVYVDQPVHDKNTDLDLEAGCYTMNGHDALQYARVRHGVQGGDGSDLQRIGRQQHIMSIMMREAMAKNLMTSAPSLYNFARAGLSSLTTSTSLSNLSTLSGLAYSLRELKPENILFLSAPVTEDPYDRNRVVFTEKADTLWQVLAADSTLPGGFEVKDGNSKAYTTSDPSAANNASQSAPESNSPQSASPTPTSSSPTPSTQPSTSAPASTEDPVEAARAKCEAKG